MNNIVTISSKGQVVVPVEIRKAIGLGDRFVLGQKVVL